MTVAKRIENARNYLADGNGKSYAQAMSAIIRSAMSDRAANTVRKAIDYDGTANLFAALNTNCPTAA